MRCIIGLIFLSGLFLAGCSATRYVHLDKETVQDWNKQITGTEQTIRTRDGQKTSGALVSGLSRDSIHVRVPEGEQGMPLRDVAVITDEGQPVLGFIGLVAGGAVGALFAGEVVFPKPTTSDPVEGFFGSIGRTVTIGTGIIIGGLIGWWIGESAGAAVHRFPTKDGMVAMTLDSSKVVVGKTIRFTWGETEFELDPEDIWIEKNEDKVRLRALGRKLFD